SFESAFAAFRSAGFDVSSTYAAVKATIVAVLGVVLEDTAPLRTRTEPTDLEQLPIERFPHIHAMSRVARKADTFTYLVEALIAGFAASRKRRSRPKAAST
ncbi:MAG: hypothetical protein ACREST_08815, partial [Steroidobacteraceae bacterium]